MKAYEYYLNKLNDRGIGYYIKSLWNKCVRRLYILFMGKCHRVKEDKILFLTFSGRYECNPKWICEEFIRQGSEYELVWGIQGADEDALKEFPKCVKLVNKDSLEFLKELSQAKVIIDNGIGVAYYGYSVKPEQTLIETWHGSLGIKRFDSNTNRNRIWVKQARKEGRMTDYIISNSEFENGVYTDSFWKNSEIWTMGHARNDILFLNDEESKVYANRIRTKYGIDDKYHLCLYAPTFRDDGNLTPYELDYVSLARSLSERFGGEWLILSRFHWKTREKLKGHEFPDCVINVSDYGDIQEILCAIDAGITDYSSWICEYIHRRKPGFIFATDFRRFEDEEREFFFPLTYMPFPVSDSEEALLKNIADFDEKKYQYAIKEFLDDMVCVDDGQAAKRIVKKIKEDCL